MRASKVRLFRRAGFDESPPVYDPLLRQRQQELLSELDQLLDAVVAEGPRGGTTQFQIRPEMQERFSSMRKRLRVAFPAQACLLFDREIGELLGRDGPLTMSPLELVLRAERGKRALRDEAGDPWQRISLVSSPKPDAEQSSVPSRAPSSHLRPALAPLALGALGVVYGDIGTSPLYALRQCFVGGDALPPTPENVLGVLSLVFWSLVIVVSVKYLTVLMRADNRGEGGILALLALVNGPSSEGRRARTALVILGLFGAALLYGDGVITPAISVLSAVEGLQVATHAFSPYIVAITIVILVALFSVQKHGTAGIAAVFGPTMLAWFAVIGAIGLVRVLHQSPQHPSVLAAMNPLYAIEHFVRHGMHGFLILGAVVLVITGAEALYADMGHFGPRPIRFAWWGAAFPALLLNYFGQGVLLMERGAAVRSPFFELAPAWALYPLVALATIATIIASQALISGAFSLTQQAVQLGYAPRFNVVHTSETAHGQIFVPEVNRGLMLTCVLLVLGFRRSDQLAGAYGIAVTGTMAITTVLFYVVARERWHWTVARAGSIAGLFLIFDLAFFTANLPKFLDGGWFPLSVGLLVFLVMTTWKRGRAELGRILRETSFPLDLFLDDLRQQRPHRVDGTAVFMTSTPTGVPPVLLHHFKHNKVLHSRVLLLSILTEGRPQVVPGERLDIAELGEGFYRVVARFGFMEKPTIDEVFGSCRTRGLACDPAGTSFFLGRETLLATGTAQMALWRKKLFALISRNAPSATTYFGIPPNRVVELGAQIEL